MLFKAKWKLCICLILLWHQAHACVDAQEILPSNIQLRDNSNALPAHDQIENLSKQILLKNIALERYNLNYLLNVARQGRWKGWRYVIGQEIADDLYVPGYIIGIVQRAGEFNTGKPGRTALEAQNKILMIGQIIAGSSSALEFGINVWHDIEARKNGYSPAAARMQVLNLRHDIDNLLMQREQLIKKLLLNNSDYKYLAVMQAEENILADMRDVSLQEFQTYHSGLRKLLALQQSLYFFDVARNTVGAMANWYAYVPLTNGHRFYNLDAGLLGAISGGITMLSPLVSRGFSKMVGIYHKHYISACVTGTKNIDRSVLETDLATLKNVIIANQIDNRLPILTRILCNEKLPMANQESVLRWRKATAGALSAAENITSGMIIGGTRVTSSVFFIVAGMKYRESGYHTNIQLGIANIIGETGAVYAAVENLRVQINREILYHKLKKREATTEQIAMRRLKELDEIEKSIKAQPIAFSN